MRTPSIVIVAALGIVASAAAQVAAPPSPKAAPPPTLAQIGMFIYPAQQQTKEQQAGDEEACTRWAESQTGLVLQARSVDTQAAAKSAEKAAAEKTEGAAVVGAAKGAAAGVAIGAIAGDAGKGGPRPRGTHTCPLSGTFVLPNGHGVLAGRFANADILILPVTNAGLGEL